MSSAAELAPRSFAEYGLPPIPVRGDPDGLVYDPGADALYVADGYSGAITRIEGNRQRRVATIETGGVVATQRIAGIAITRGGTLFVARIGHGRAGALFQVDADGLVAPIGDVDPTAWRAGVTYAPLEGLLYTTQYHCAARGPHDGCIVAVDLVSGAPSLVLDGFAKPVGIAKLDDVLVVADARQRAVFRVDLRAGRAVRRLQLAADIERPDSVCVAGADAVLVTSYDEARQVGTVRELRLDGRARVIASGTWEPRGVATDGTRVFVAAHRAGHILVFPR